MECYAPAISSRAVHHATLPDAGGEPIAVLRRAFELLGVLSAGPGDCLSLAEIARRSALPKTTALRLLTSLVQLDAVERIGAGYQLGGRLFEFGERVPQRRYLREAALPFMGDLYEVTHETVHLAVLEGTDVLYVERILGHRTQPRPPSRVGGHLPAYCTGVGKALLAFTPEATKLLIAESPLVARTRYTIVDPNLLLAELRMIRESGIAHDKEESMLGIHCVAAPILLDGTAVAALSVSGSTDRIALDRVESAVKTAALGLRRQLTLTRRFISRNEELASLD